MRGEGRLGRLLGPRRRGLPLRLRTLGPAEGSGVEVPLRPFGCRHSPACPVVFWACGLRCPQARPFPFLVASRCPWWEQAGLTGTRGCRVSGGGSRLGQWGRQECRDRWRGQRAERLRCNKIKWKVV